MFSTDKSSWLIMYYVVSCLNLLINALKLSWFREFVGFISFNTSIWLFIYSLFFLLKTNYFLRREVAHPKHFRIGYDNTLLKYSWVLSVILLCWDEISDRNHVLLRQDFVWQHVRWVTTFSGYPVEDWKNTNVNELIWFLLLQQCNDNLWGFLCVSLKTNGPQEQ